AIVSFKIKQEEDQTVGFIVGEKNTGKLPVTISRRSFSCKVTKRMTRSVLKYRSSISKVWHYHCLIFLWHYHTSVTEKFWQLGGVSVWIRIIVSVFSF
ncbi:hypothetical protein VIGAN_08013300, partial [Vigna angularis var. angularis]